VLLRIGITKLKGRWRLIVISAIQIVPLAILMAGPFAEDHW
jgi:hypothetical protein